MRVKVKAFPEAGFYRAGRFWPFEATEADVTTEQLERLKAEPRLSVEVLDGKAKAEPKGKDTEDGQGGAGNPPTPPQLPEGEGSPLPEGFPAREKLEAAGFKTIESLAGMTYHQLVSHKLAAKEAKAVTEELKQLAPAKE